MKFHLTLDTEDEKDLSLLKLIFGAPVAVAAAPAAPAAEAAEPATGRRGKAADKKPAEAPKVEQKPEEQPKVEQKPEEQPKAEEKAADDGLGDFDAPARKVTLDDLRARIKALMAANKDVNRPKIADVLKKYAPETGQLPELKVTDYLKVDDELAALDG